MQPQSYMQFAFEAKDSLLFRLVPENEVAVGRRPEDAQVFAQDSHQCWTSAYQKTKLLWGEVQRIRRRIRRGFERIRNLFGGFAYEAHIYCVGF